jgi:predicted transcriptional regulator
MKLFDAELKVMEVLWKEGDVTARRLTELLKEKTGWSKTTTYTVIKRCIDKGAIKRLEPYFTCRALVSIEQAREYETSELIGKMYAGAPDLLVASVLGSKKLSKEEISRLKQVVEAWGGVGE